MSMLLSDFKILSEPEIFALLLKYNETGCEISRNTIIESYMGVIFKSAHKYKSSMYGFDELVSAGVLGVVSACEHNNLDSGSFFAGNYFTKFINGYMLNYIRQRSHFYKRNSSIFEMVNENESFVDTLADEHLTPLECVIDNDTVSMVRKSLSILTPTENFVIRKYFGIGQEDGTTLEGVSEELKISKEGVRLSKQSGLRKIRHHLQQCENAVF